MVLGSQAVCPYQREVQNILRRQGALPGLRLNGHVLQGDGGLGGGADSVRCGFPVLGVGHRHGLGTHDHQLPGGGVIGVVLPVLQVLTGQPQLPAVHPLQGADLGLV